ncbi:MAG: two-component system sensor histidine kinase NtrB [Thermaurantiacus sp.]
MASLAEVLPRHRIPPPAELWNALPAPSLLLAPDGRVVLANSACEAFINASFALLAERGLDHVLSPDSVLRDFVEEARVSGQGIAAYDVTIEFLGGRQHRADVLIGVLPDRDGPWLSICFQPRSVTALVDRQLGQQGAARSAMAVAAMLAHEIRNPLSGIRGAAQLLAPQLDSDGSELAGLIMAEVDRIRALIDRMEGFTDTRPAKRRPENIHAILGHVRRLAETGFGAHLQFKERYDPSLPPVHGDRDRLVQALLNLVKNAVEASPEGGTITLTTAFRQGVWLRPPGSPARVSLPLEVCVIDQGEGPPAHVADHLFEPFVSSRRGGTGLGLALVAKVVGEHGGVVECQRREGETVFRVLLPLARDGAGA